MVQKLLTIADLKARNIKASNVQLITGKFTKLHKLDLTYFDLKSLIIRLVPTFCLSLLSYCIMIV